jgi:hypothetical protein
MANWRDKGLPEGTKKMFADSAKKTAAKEKAGTLGKGAKAIKQAVKGASAPRSKPRTTASSGGTKPRTTASSGGTKPAAKPKPTYAHGKPGGGMEGPSIGKGKLKGRRILSKLGSAWRNRDADKGRKDFGVG